LAEATTILLVRHASHVHQGRILVGRLPNVSLGEAGRAEVARVAGLVSGWPVTAVYSSPLERARDTAAPVAEALDLDVRVEDSLNEIDFGEWAGASFQALDGDPRWHVWNRERAAGSPPGGEPMAAVRERAAAQVARWREDHADETVLAVSHADVIKAFVCDVLDLSLDRHGAFDIDPASVTTLVAWEGGGKVVRLNERAPA
jgi:probable phosphoglycerate mutase